MVYAGLFTSVKSSGNKFEGQKVVEYEAENRKVMYINSHKFCPFLASRVTFTTFCCKEHGACEDKKTNYKQCYFENVIDWNACTLKTFDSIFVKYI